jgi:hypothetical protein
MERMIRRPTILGAVVISTGCATVASGLVGVGVGIGLMRAITE